MSVPSLSEALFQQYINRPRELFYERLDRLSTSARLAALEEARRPRIEPTRQLPYPDAVIEIRERQQQRRANIADDFAADLKEICEFRRRFELDLPDTIEPCEAQLRDAYQPPQASPLPAFEAEPFERWLDDRWEAKRAQDSEDATHARMPTDIREEEEEDRILRRDEAEDPKRPRLAASPYADPVVRKSGIQFFTGTQLDVLI